MVMHHANHFYGHAHILARYAGVEEEAPPRILGYLQHGWNILDGYATGTHFAPGLTKFVWSDGPRRRGWAMGRTNYYIVGAPWIYLLALEPRLGKIPERDRAGSIFYPFHGWEGQQIFGDHRQLIRTVLEVETEPVTACLYFNEYRNPQVRKLYQDSGFRVISHGRRGHSYKGTDPAFLYRQLGELRRHKRVISNRLTTAVLYGLSVGCEAGIYGDPMILESEDPAFGGAARMRRLWPELHRPAVPASVAREVMETELGQAHRASPPEIQEVFGWTQEAKRRHEAEVLPEPGVASDASESMEADEFDE